MFDERSPSNLRDILTVGDGLLFAGLLVALFFSENRLDLLVQVLAAVAHEQNLQGLLNRDSAAEVFVVHQEGHKVVELAWLEVLRVADASFVHRLELEPGDETVEVIVDFLHIKRRAQIKSFNDSDSPR